MSNDLLFLFNLIKAQLYASSPVLSGNMKSYIKTKNVGENEITIVIEAPFYNTKEYKKTKKVVYTHQIIYGKTDYAYWVNKIGAFGTHNKSEHWVNRVLNDVCEGFSSKINAKVENRLPL